MSGPASGPPSKEEAPGKFKTRDFYLTSLSLGNTTSVLVLLAIIVILGIISYRTIPKESSPEITIPMIAVNTSYPGVSPGDMETLVTRVIEEDLSTIPDMSVLTSTSVEGYSSILAEFGAGSDMNEALQRVREKVDLAKADLPTDANDPMIMEFVLSEFPIMQVNISGEYDLVQLKEVATDLQERLEQIPTILEVGLSGGLEREVKVEVDLPKLQYYELGFGDVVAAISAENLTIPGGSIDVGNQKYLVRVDGEFRDTRVIEDIVITAREDRPIYVRDVATVDFGFQERTSYARLNGNPVVTLDIVKRSGENIIETADAVRRVVAEESPGFPESTVVEITSDLSEEIHMMVSSLENNIISGLILVLGILLFFLALGIKYVRPENWTPFAPNGFNGVWTGASLIFFAYIGFDAISTAAEESKNPKRDMPFAILMSLLVTSILYIAVTAVLTGMLPWNQLGTAEPLVTAFTERGLNIGAGIIAFGAVVATTSVLLVFQLGQPRIFYAMARDGLLPGWAATVHKKYRTPHITTIMTGIFVAVFAAVAPIEEVIELTNIGTLFAFIIVAAGILVLRKVEPDRPRPFRTPFVPLVPILAILSCLWLMLGLPWITWARFGIWLLVGIAIYFLYGKKRSVLQRELKSGE